MCLQGVWSHSRRFLQKISITLKSTPKQGDSIIVLGFNFSRAAFINHIHGSSSMVSSRSNLVREFPPRNPIGILNCLLISLIFIITLPEPQSLFAEEADLDKGKALYEKHCAVCHGLTGKGDGYRLFDPQPTDLTSEQIQKKSYDALWDSVHDGIPDTAMGMWRTALTDKEITMILSYVRSLPQ